MAATFAEVFQAGPNAIERALPSADDLASATEDDRSRLIMLIYALVPEIEAAPVRNQRLVDAVWDWMMVAPPTIRLTEEIRGQLVQIFDAHAASAAKALAAAKYLQLPPPLVRRLEDSLDTMLRDREQTFRHWSPFTEQDMQEAIQEIKEGKGHDLDELIHELQSRLERASPA